MFLYMFMYIYYPQIKTRENFANKKSEREVWKKKHLMENYKNYKNLCRLISLVAKKMFECVTV